MKKLYACLTLSSLMLLGGCFDHSDNETQNNTDGSKSSVQVKQKDAADESK
jgi:protein involved in sex pheromone biosynthesis